MTEQNRENRIKILEMRVKKYQLEMSQIQKKNGEYINLVQNLEKLLEEKVDELIKLGEQNHLTMQLYRNEIKLIKNQIKTLQTSLLNIENEMMGLHDEIINKTDTNFEKQDVIKIQDYTNDFNELKQSLAHINNLIKSNQIDNINLSQEQPKQQKEENKSHFTFRDLQNASIINSTSSMNKQRIFGSSAIQKPIQSPRTVESFQNIISEEIPKTTENSQNEKEEGIKKEHSIEEKSNSLIKEKKAPSAFSFFKRKD
ncbi:hypothetical protein ACQKCU_20205 [Heyndrickxia sporothermodurans]